jgi:hypothetical protein
MGWEERLLALFDDLEQEAEGLALADRDLEVAELGRAEYAAVDLAARLHASVGLDVAVQVAGPGRLDGRLCAAGRDWLLLAAAAARPAQEWLVRLPALVSVEGLSDRAVPEPARGVAARLGVGSALRRLAESREPVLLAHVDGTTVRGRLRRVGADFVEVVHDGERQGVGLAAFGHLAAVRRG